MDALLREYLPILIFLGLAFALVCAMVGGSYLVARQNPNSEKLSPFECGFPPFDDARGQGAHLQGVENAKDVQLAFLREIGRVGEQGERDVHVAKYGRARRGASIACGRGPTEDNFRVQ